MSSSFLAFASTDDVRPVLKKIFGRSPHELAGQENTGQQPGKLLSLKHYKSKTNIPASSAVVREATRYYEESFPKQSPDALPVMKGEEVVATKTNLRTKIEDAGNVVTVRDPGNKKVKCISRVDDLVIRGKPFPAKKAVCYNGETRFYVLRPGEGPFQSPLRRYRKFMTFKPENAIHGMVEKNVEESSALPKEFEKQPQARNNGYHRPTTPPVQLRTISCGGGFGAEVPKVN